MIVFIWVLGWGYIEVVYYLLEVGVNFDVVDKVCGVCECEGDFCVVIMWD